MLGIVVAMQSEAEPLIGIGSWKQQTKLFNKPVYCGTVFKKESFLIVCGVGKVNAAAGTALAIQRGATAILNFGVAGGLSPEREEVAGVYLIEKAVQYDFDLTQLNGGEIGTLDGDTENYIPLTVPAINLPRRVLASGDRFNDSPLDHALLCNVLHADIRDMEGAAIAQVCRDAGVPFFSVKAISDVYGESSTTEQFQRNLRLAMQNLSGYFKEIFAAFDE